MTPVAADHAPLALTDELLRLSSVTVAYGRDPVLVDVDLSVRAGSFTGIVGPSGSGKTTLLKVLTGGVRPAVGRVDRPRGAVRIGYVPQVETVNWFFPVTVLEAVLMARPGRRVPWPSRAERAEAMAMLAELGLDGLAGRHIRALSGGQQQRVFVARALLRRPDVLLLDEPTSGVDVRTRHDVMHLLHELHHRGLAILLTTHDLNGIAAHLPHLVCLNRRVIATGPPDAVITPEVLERAYGAPMEVLQHGGMRVVVESAPDVGIAPEVKPLRGGHHGHAS